MDRDPLGSSVHGILQARILEWVAMASPGDLPNPGMEPASLMSPALAGRFFTIRATWEAPESPIQTANLVELGHPLSNGGKERKRNPAIVS